MNSLHTFIIFTGGMVALLLLGSLHGQAVAGEDCRKLIQNKCASCHFVKYICPKIEQNKGTLSWKYTINSMVKVGMMVTDQEQGLLVSCLADPDEQVRSLCQPKK